MSLWHLSPPLFACVNSSDLFTFTVFPFPDLESAEDPFVRSGGLSVDGVYECIYFIAKPLPPNTAPFLSCLRIQQQRCTQRSSCVDAVLCIYATSSVSIFIGTCL